LLGDVAVRQDVAQIEQLGDNRVDTLADRELAGVERDLGIEWGLVGVINAGEALDLSGAGLGVEALDVALFADVDRGVAEDLDEVPPGELAGVLAGPAVGADHGAEGGAAVLGDEAGDVADTVDVLVAVFLAEAQPLRQMGPDLVAVQERDIAPK